METPARTSLCLQCRTALADDEACDVCGDESVMSLGVQAERHEAIEAAWVEERLPPDTNPPLIAPLALMGGVGLSLVATAIAFAVTMSFLVVIAGLALAVTLLLSPLITDKLREANDYREPEGELVLRARGSTMRPTMPTDWPALTGTIVPLFDNDDPAGHRAELMELRTETDEITLRDAESRGFAVALDDGRRLVVPAGRIRIDVEPSKLTRASVNDAMRRVRHVDPRASRGDDNPIPFGRQLSKRLRIGDRVEVRTLYDESIETDGGYRNAAEVTLTPRGLPWIKPLD